MLARLFMYLQYLLPRFWLTGLIYRVARIRNVSVKDFLITKFVRLYDVDIDDVRLDVPGDFETFNAFFIRELESNARPVNSDVHSIVSPVDGTISSAGPIRNNSIFQAKGLDYSLEDLLTTDLQDARRYIDGSYATIYLAPYDYHRIHAPLDGKVVAARYIPGDLFSVNTATAANVPGLFRRNERLVVHLESAHGPYALVFVGALNVGSISTPWSGEIRPRKTGVVEMISLESGPDAVHKGDLLGWFNMGSTVILLLPAGASSWKTGLDPKSSVRMGETIGTIQSA
jgi:phosphatidylserine decarboxylase